MSNKELEKGSLVLFLTIFVTNVISYIFNLLASRLFSVSEFGTINVLMSLFLILSIPGTVVSTVITKYIANYDIVNEKRNIGFFVKSNYKIVFIAVLILTFLEILLSPLISKKMNINNIFYVIFIIIVSSVSIICSIIGGLTQGLKKFFTVGNYYLIQAICKIMPGLFLSYLGFGIYGIIIGLLSGFIISQIYGIFSCMKTLSYNFFKPDQLKINLDFKYLLNFILTILFVQFALSLLSNIDMILVKIFFTSEIAGIYSGALIWGKIILMIPLAIVIPLFTLTTHEKNNKKREDKLLLKSLLYGGGLAFFTSIFINLFKKIIILYMMGNKYISSMDFVFPISVLVCSITLLTILFNFCLALNNTFFLKISFFLIYFFSIVIIYKWHNNIEIIIYILTISNILLFVINFIYIFNRKEMIND